MAKKKSKKKGGIKAKARREVQAELAPSIKAVKRQQKQGSYNNELALQMIGDTARGANAGTNKAYGNSAAYIQDHIKRSAASNQENQKAVKADSAASIASMQSSQSSSINEASAALQALGIGGNAALGSVVTDNRQANDVANYGNAAADFNAADAGQQVASVGKLMLNANEATRQDTVDQNVTERIQGMSDQRLSWLDQKEQFSNALAEIEDKRPKMVKDMIKQLEQEKMANEAYKRQTAAYRSYGGGGGGYSSYGGYSGGSSGGSSPYSAMGGSGSSTKRVTINADPGGSWWGAPNAGIKSKNSGSPASWLPDPRRTKMKGIANGTW